MDQLFKDFLSAKRSEIILKINILIFLLTLKSVDQLFVIKE